MRDDEDADAEAEEIRRLRELPVAEGEIAERRLCPDGACTGVIGDDGCCKVCGRRDEGAPVRAHEPGAAVDADEDVGSAGEDGAAGAPGDDADRRLCPDGACTGLIGDDGCCKVCGQRAEA